MVEESSFEGLIAVDGDDEALAMTGFAEDVVAALDALKLPSVALCHAHEVLAGDLLHASILSSGENTSENFRFSEK